jgi:hypothetical protein
MNHRDTEKKNKKQFEYLIDAALNGSAEDVRRMIADGTPPDNREEENDPTPLKVAAAHGRLDIVKALVDAGADVNALAEDHSGELDQFPFIDELFADAWLTALTALAYAALYREEQVYRYLALRTAPELRREAEAVRRARAEYPTVEARPYPLPETPKSSRQMERKELLASSGAARRWVVQCVLCQKQGYKSAMPKEIDRRGTATPIRKLFPPLILQNYFCQQCHDRDLKAKEKLAAKLRGPRAVKARQEAEERQRQRRAELDAPSDG